MPGLSRKVLVYAATDGLIIRPLTPRGHRPLDPVIVRYGSASVSPASVSQIPTSVESPGPWFEAFGVVGLITVSGLSFLVTITRCERVADIAGHTVHVITRVAVTPCSSYAEAEESARKTGVHLQARSPPCRVPNGDEDEDSPSSDEEAEIQDLAVDEVDDALPNDANAMDPTRSSVVEDVIRRKGTYGRFAQRWFSRCGWTLEQRRTLGLTNSPSMSPPPVASPASPSLTPMPQNISVGDAGSSTLKGRRVPVSTLLPKLLSTIQVLFGSSRSFYFSYDMDITRRRTSEVPSPSFSGETPLHARVDPVFFWNRHILTPFLEAGCDALALPLMQGFVRQKHFVVDSRPPQIDADTRSSESVELADLSPAQSPPSSPSAAADGALNGGRLLRPSERRYQITLISRRSTKRAGLRYLRRGVDEDGFVANSVETEQILSSASPSWDDSPVYSFLQIRGSIPLFFTQSPYSLKPVPVLQHSDAANFKALKLHFERLSKEFGSLQVVNLVEEQNMEGPLGSKFQDFVERLNQDLSHERQEKQVAFEWFDFHHVCRGMKFENVSILLSLLKDKIEDFGSTIERDGALVQHQRGVLRTNCMDCLDRTNVCQSSFAKHMLDWQLKQEGIDMEAQRDQENAWFNILWADNGDAVSKQYASTAAMKGDYTRTRKRDYRGALNDLGLSVARLYSGMVNDYFSQAAIDFLLGNVTDKVFDEFEADMMTKDPAVSVEKMRERAIELCQRRVVADAREDVHGCWVLLSPKMPDVANVVKSGPMEEVVFLLTDAALYLCRFNWDLDKVSSFERVSLASITGIVRGVYITSTVSPLHVDEAKNVGFVVTYHPGLSDVRRTNTRTLSTSGGIVPTAGAGVGAGAVQEEPKPERPETRKLALKAPYADSSNTAATRPGPGPGPRQTEEEMVANICAEIERLVFERQPFKAVEGRGPLIQAGDIISLDDAKRNTGYLEQLGHSLKRLVWA